MKSASSGLNSHIAQEVTTLATCWRVTRTDGVAFHFTDHDVDIPFDLADLEGAQTYKASSSYNRTAIKNTDSLAVDNLDLTGVLQAGDIDETELRRGLFDFARVEIFLVNWTDLSQGVIRMRRGWLGEVTITPNGYFIAELRGLAQAFARRVGELYSPECRADLGDDRCKIPIAPASVRRATTYAVGDYVRCSPLLNAPHVTDCELLVHFDTSAADSSDNAAVPVLGSQAAIQTVQKKFGAGAVEFSPSGSVDPSNAFVQFNDIAPYALSNLAFTIEGWFRFKDLTATVQVLAAQWTSTGNQRSWSLQRNGANLELVLSGAGTAVNLTVTGAVTWAIDTWYHVAATRRGNVFKLWVDGVEVGTATNVLTLFNSTAPVYIGKRRSSGSSDDPLFGFADEFRLTVGGGTGGGIYDATFTPEAQAFETLTRASAALTAVDYDPVNYRCTTAGITFAAAQYDYDSGIGNTTTDGSAVFTAEAPWSFQVQVTAVDGTTPRKKFTVTELTPDTGVGTPGRDYFPSDSMNGGVVTWATGPNAKRAMEVRDFTGGVSSQVVELFLAMPFDIQVGDRATIYRGCFKRLEDCRDVFANTKNMRAEPYVPGQDRLMQYPDAKG